MDPEPFDPDESGVFVVAVRDDGPTAAAFAPVAARAALRSGAALRTLDAVLRPDLALRLRVRMVPGVLVVRDGEIVARCTGPCDEAAIVALCAPFAPPPVDPPPSPDIAL